jgi:23S rRNA (adenine2503-C2)-methyltransferase
VERLTDADGFNMAARHITISTVGHVAGIRRLANEGLQVGLAVSLHAPDDALRQQLIPTAHRYALSEILDACAYYFEQTRRRVTFEYCLMAGVNDSVEQAKALADLIRALNCHVNLIPVNPTPDERIWRPSRDVTLAFERALRDRGIACTVRVEKGVEISAACGQLRAPSDGRPNLAALPLVST